MSGLSTLKSSFITRTQKRRFEDDSKQNPRNKRSFKARLVLVCDRVAEDDGTDGRQALLDRFYGSLVDALGVGEVDVAGDVDQALSNGGSTAHTSQRNSFRNSNVSYSYYSWT